MKEGGGMRKLGKTSRAELELNFKLEINPSSSLSDFYPAGLETGRARLGSNRLQP